MNTTTIESDPRGAASFLHALRLEESELFQDKSNQDSNLFSRNGSINCREEISSEIICHKDRDKDWFTRSSEEVQEVLGRDSLWKNDSPVGIGWDYEKLSGVNIGGTHPVIDDVRVVEGVVTSMKTMNTHSFSYSEPERIIHKAAEYVDAFQKLTSVKVPDGTELPLDEIKGFHLEIAVRPDLTLEQRNAFEKVQKYGEENGVRVIIVEVA